MHREGDALAHIATITSRPHALVVATLLENDGIPVWIDGDYHASVDPISVALGGHRLTISVSEWGRASALIRDAGLPWHGVAYRGGQRAVLRFVGVCYGTLLALGIPGAFLGLVPYQAIPLIPLAAITTPVDPRGPNDWHLAPDAE